jgi:hypothetical protein
MKIPPLTGSVPRFPVPRAEHASCGITALARAPTALEEVDFTSSTYKLLNPGPPRLSPGHGPGVTQIACRGTHFWCYCRDTKTYECCPLTRLKNGGRLRPGRGPLPVQVAQEGVA